MGTTVAESKALYRDLATRHPSNALALNHETSGTCSLLLTQIEDVLIITKHSFDRVCILSPLIPIFDDILFLAMMFFHMLCKSFALVDMHLSHWLDV